MPFTQQYILSVNPPVPTLGGLKLSWTSDQPTGQVFQVYGPSVDGASDLPVLLWHGLSNSATVPLPPPGETVQYSIGTVDTADAGTSFAASLAPQPRARAYLTWDGGAFEGVNTAGFHIYGEHTPGGGVDYATVLDDIPLTVGGITTDGWGLGGFGQCGFGMVGGNYSFTSTTLTSGSWTFAVVPYDLALNEGTGRTAVVVILVPPQEVPVDTSGNRVEYTLLAYGQTPFGVGGYGEPEVVLSWLPSPG